ncbi:MAG: GWxTD domain-containing protein [Bacteroidota bacterium]
MRKTLLSLGAGFITCVAFAQTYPLEVYHETKSFHAPDGKNMVEVYLQVNAATVKFSQKSNSTYQSTVEVTEIIKQGDKIIDYKKNEVSSPEMPDTAITDYTDQQRFVLPDGDYELEITVKDLRAENGPPFSVTVPLKIARNDKAIGFSDIQLVESFKKAEVSGPITKSGYDIAPFVSTYYPVDINKIAYYSELYNSGMMGADEKFLVYQYIENAETGTQMSSWVKFNRNTAKEVIPVLSYFDISSLRTGNYNLVLEVKNKNNETVAVKKIFFQRNNPASSVSMDDLSKVDIKATFVERMDNEDTLTEFIASLRPVASPAEISMVDRLVKTHEDFELKKQFFYSFWSSRSSDPENAWRKYNLAVKDVQRMFGTRIRKGYETDRGITFLKYGAPDDVMDRPNEPGAYPYQIWHYHKVGKFNNKRFIFYLPDLVTNDYAVLHSDVPGEIKNYRWEQVLNSRNTPNSNLDDPNAVPQWGGNSKEYFKNPR